MDIDQLKALLGNRCDQAGSQRAWASQNDISPAHVNDVLKGHRGPGAKILKALGLIKRVDYQKRNDHPPKRVNGKG
jgi:hypothetical protein